MSIGYEGFKWVAQKLGLRIDPPEADFWRGRHTLDGIVDGVRVHVAQWQGQFVHVGFYAYLEPPADLRLSITPVGVVSKLGHFLGLHDIEVGDPEFDGAFEIKADEPERAKKLLDPQLQRALLAWRRSNVSFHVTDEEVTFWTIPGAYSSVSAEDVEANVLACAALVKELNRALKGVPPSTILAPHVEAWRTYAAGRGLDFSASPLRVTGDLDGARFTARATAIDGGAWGVDVGLCFRGRLPFHVRVRPARFFDFLERTGDAVRLELGDAEFDRELRVTTNDEEKARELLDPGVRAALRDLHRDEGDLQLDSTSLSVRTKAMTDPSAFARIVDRVATVAEKVHGRARPYR